jgi:hypothetical protein
MALRLGIDAKLYRNTGNYATPVLNPVDNCRDLTLGLEKNEADVTTRGNDGWRALVGVLKEATIEFNMIADGADEDYIAFRDAFLNNTNIEVFVMSADVDEADSEGLRATCSVLGFTRNEPLEEALNIDVTLRPTYNTNAPEWVDGSDIAAYD